MPDCLVVGGGVIGLSLAYELAGHGLSVRVIDRGQPGQEASWAGAGILPPAVPVPDDPLGQLVELSNRLHADWTSQLRDSTGIDNGFRRCGAIYLGREPAAKGQLDRFMEMAQGGGVAVRRLSPSGLAELEPGLLPHRDPGSAYVVDDECQIRNPRHLKALVAACVGRGVQFAPGAAAEDFEIQGGRIRAVRTVVGSFSADTVCVTAGSWTSSLASKLGLAIEVKPVRGQMVLLGTAGRVLNRIVNEGARYLVPRDDGRLLVGSTEEDAGFDRSTTAGAIAGLLDFALALVPRLREAQVERSWAGLRPATPDGLPYLGRVPGLDNAFVAAGHFRGGLQLSTGTAVVMSQLIRGHRPCIELSAYDLERDARDILEPRIGVAADARLAHPR